MKLFLITSFLFLFNPQVKAERVDSKHEKCLKASDYAGCMDYQENKNIPPISKKKNDCTKQFCDPKEITQETDNLGMKIIPNFWFLEDPVKRIAFYNDLENLYKVKANGEYGRFFHHRMIYRYFSKGYSGYSSLSGGGDTNCYSYGSSIDCTTTMPNLVTIPGKASGVEQVNIDLIYDCLDKTTAVYWDNKLRKVIVCLRGVIGAPPYRHIYKSTRWQPDLMMIQALKDLNANIPIIYDPSHATGKRSFVKGISLAALVTGADGLIIEAHHDPTNSISDPDQAISFLEFGEIVKLSGSAALLKN